MTVPPLPPVSESGQRPRPCVLSLGGGLDSWVMLLEAVRRGERVDVVAFIDVADPDHQDPGEWPATYRHIEEVVRPFCAAHGIEFVVLDTARYPVRDARSLFAWLEARRQIPVAGPTRICTRVAKVERFERWLDDRFPGEEVEVWIGFEAGEEGRVDKDPNVGSARRKPPKGVDPALFAATTARRVNRFPLVEWKICRCRAEQLARASGHPVPRKSACTYCPYGSRGDWQRFAVGIPEQFSRVVRLEADKPLTGRGKKLSIMGYDSRTQRGTPLPAYVARPYTRRPKPCGVCGALDRATKAAGCDYLSEREMRPVREAREGAPE